VRPGPESGEIVDLIVEELPGDHLLSTIGTMYLPLHLDE
jgi:hypothetical protein